MTAAVETKSRERKWSDQGTARERVLCESLQAEIKKLTGKDVELDDVRAVRFSINRWQASPEYKALQDDISEKIKVAELQNRREKAAKALAELDNKLGELGAEEDDDLTVADEDDTDGADVDDIFAEASA